MTITMDPPPHTPARDAKHSGAATSDGDPTKNAEGKALDRGVVTGLRAAQAVLAEQARDRAAFVRLTDAEVGVALGQVDDLGLHLERVLLELVAEADLRGLPQAAGLSLRDWLCRRCPWTNPHQVGAAITVADGIAHPDHGPVAAAIDAGVLPLRRAARVLRALGKIRAVCDDDTYAADISIVLEVATSPRYTDNELARVTDRLIAAALPERDLEDRDRIVRDLRGINESSIAGGALRRFVITCEPAGAAMIHSVITSSLAAPAPDTEGRDPRTATQRRYDAFVTMLGRGIGAPAGSPSTAKAKVVITVGMDALTGLLQGAGFTLTGDQLSPTTARMMACNADLIPTIFGTHGEILETVKPTRYATETQLLTLYQRDGGCTFPGCTTPPQWCDAHHVTWHSRGGPTALNNLALLCGRHHTIVHQRDLTADINHHGAHWHL